MDTELLARHAQRILAGLDESALARIEAHVYEDRADFEALAAIERSYVPGQPPPSPPAGSWLAFVFSKPSLEAGVVHVHVLEHENAQGAIELWMKLKRAESLPALFPEAKAIPNVAAAIQRFIVELDPPTYALPVRCGDDVLVKDGPTWLRTDPEITRDGSNLRVRLPFTETPLDAPPRFAGHHYVKVVRRFAP